VAYSAEESRQRVVALAQIAVTIGREGLLGEPRAFAHHDSSRYLVPKCVLAIEGDEAAKVEFLESMLRMADAKYGVDTPGGKNRLDDSFNLRSVVEAYHGLIDRALVATHAREGIAVWLYDFALAAADGRVMRQPGFEQWHLRNQNVPATCVYNIAHLLDQTQRGRFDTTPLWEWADAQIVGWDLTWRDPDDSWLYQYIWTWSAYLHARYRRLDLLQSDHARRCCDFYTRLQPTGLGCDVVFGDSKPGDLLGPMVSLLLGAKLHHDGVLLHAALRMLDEVERRGTDVNVIDRAPELYRLYTLWPDDVNPTPPPPRVSELILSPLAGRGWSFDEATYDVDIKRMDKRFPFFGQNTCCWDAMYQVQDPAAYEQQKPDKLIFAQGNEPSGTFALADLRCHGLHDHADTLGVITLIDQAVPWLVESTYLPRDEMRLRWYHNVPLFRPGKHSIGALKHWRSDTWREVESGDVWLRDFGDHVVAAALQRHDSYDFVPFTENMFDVLRVWVYRPDDGLIVVDQLVASEVFDATVGQIWHTTAAVRRNGDLIDLSSRGKTFSATFAHSIPITWSIEDREPGQDDPFYFPPGSPVRDLLRGGTARTSRGSVIAFAASFARDQTPIDLSQNGPVTEVKSREWCLRVGGPHEVTFEITGV